MSNHFHILVEVPQRPSILPTDEELLRLYALVHGEEKAEFTRKELELLSEEQRQTWRDGARKFRFLAGEPVFRMRDLQLSPVSPET